MLIVVAACVIGACLIGISQATEAWHFMALFGIIGISGLTAPNSLVTSVPVAKWFIRRRGRALALTTAGLGMGGIFFLPITQALIGHLGWCGSWMVLAIIFMAVSIPLAGVFLRRQPEDMGLTVDGDAIEPPPTQGPSQDLRAPGQEAEWTLGRL